MIETSKVKSDNPDHQPDGYFIKNTADLTEDDVLFDAPAKAPVPDDDQFGAMDKVALKAYLTENGVEFHHMTGEAKLLDMARGVTASDELV
jgi:hypothetical protein